MSSPGVDLEVHENMISTIERSLTDPPVRPASAVLASHLPDLPYLYHQLYQIAFADTVHDKIVEDQANNSDSSHKLQCDFFNPAMPQIFNHLGTLLLPPPCNNIGSPDNPKGLPIAKQFKNFNTCEDKVISSTIYGGFDPVVAATTAHNADLIAATAALTAANAALTHATAALTAANAMDASDPSKAVNIATATTDVNTATTNVNTATTALATAIEDIWIQPNLINGVDGNFSPNNVYHELGTIPDGHAIKTFNGKVYRVRSVEWDNATAGHDSVTGFNLGKKLGLFDEPEDIKPGGVHQHNVFYLEDATNVSVLGQLKKGDPNVNAILHILMLPEYLADSAPSKKQWAPTSLPRQSSGIKMKFAGKIQSNYPAWADNNRNTFFSRFSCIMRVRDWNKKCVKQAWTTDDTGYNNDGLFTIYNSATLKGKDRRGKGHKCGTKAGEGHLQVDQTVSRLTTGGNPQYETTFIYDSEHENSKDPVKNYLKSITGEYKKSKPCKNQIELAYQRKRSGDQMQALAIKRLQDNENFHISDDSGGLQPTNASVGTLFNNVRRRAWLCTEDRNLCSYALFLGINVLFTHQTTGFNITSFKLISNINDNFN